MDNERFRAETALAPLKVFQRRTVDYVFDRLYGQDDPVRQFLVADEVGLGKTIEAGLIWTELRSRGDAPSVQGIPLRGKVYAISLMWLSIALSCYLVPMIWARAFMLTSAVLVSLYILRQKTLPARVPHP